MNPTPKKSTDELVQSKILNGTVYHFCIRNIGLGICSVELNDKSVKETKMGK